MLESPGLTLAPWAAPARGQDRRERRAILEAATGVPLGFASRAARPRWLHWLAPSAVEVYETEDESLLCVVRGAGWIRGWHVLDADGRLVSSVRRDAIFDSEGECVALPRRGDGRGGTAWLAPGGLVVGTVAPGELGTVLSFLPATEGEPFLRMALLGAALVLTG